MEKLVFTDENLSNKWVTIVKNLEDLRSNFEKVDLDKRKIIVKKIYEILEENEINIDREKGSMYVGRYPIYEDCLRNLKVELSKKTSRNIQKELTPIMNLYSALVNEVSKRLYKKYLKCWEDISKNNLTKNVDFLYFLTKVNSSVRINEIISELKEIINRSWIELVKHRNSTIQINLTNDCVNNLIKIISSKSIDNFSPSHFSSKIHSPDFMISAQSIDDINNDKYEIVIGEVHPAVHTVSQPVAQPFCPYKLEIKNEIEDIAKRGFTVLSDSSKTYQRSHIDWINFNNLNRIILPSGVYDENSNSIRSGSCFITNENNSLIVKSRESNISENLLTVIPTQLHQICFALSSDLIGKNINSRIKIGNVILKRRSWIIHGLTLPSENKIIDYSENFIKWQSWKEKNSMPRYVFVKNPSEQKPIFVDFYNPYSLELLAYMSNKKEDMFFTEMYPNPNNLWLTDERGKYCSEFRTSYIN
jgi:hypothetical protein